MTAGERTSDGALTRRDAFLLERYRAGEGDLAVETLRSSLARTLGEAMLCANGQGRDGALETALASLPPATADGVKRALFAADIEGEEPPDPPAAPNLPAPKEYEPLAPPLPESVLQGATPQEWAARYTWLQGGTGATPWVDLYVRHAMTMSPMTPVSFHTSAALWLAAVAVARRLKVPMPYGDVYPNLFIAWIATTTLWHKSTGMNVAKHLALDVFPHLIPIQQATPEALLTDLAGKEPPNLAELDDGARQQWQRERNFAGQHGVLYDELSELLANAGRDYNAGQVEMLLRFYDCDPSFTRSTRSLGRVVVRNSYLSLLGASTPAAMAPFMSTSRSWDMGWWPRFALLTTEVERPGWEDATGGAPPAALRGGLARLYERLPPPIWPAPAEALAVRLGEHVLDDWRRYTRAVSHDLIGPALPEQLAGTYGRMPTQVLKVATLLAALDWPESEPAPCIWRDHLARAILIGEEWRENAHRVVRLVSQTAEERIELQVLALLAAYGTAGASARDLSRRLSGVGPQQVRDVLLGLEREGEVMRLPEHPRSGPGRPTERYAVVPKRADQ